MKTLRVKRTLYLLPEPCKNPKPDRRRKDWECLPEFPAGLYLLEEREEFFDRTDREDLKDKTFWIRTIRRVSSEGSLHYGEIKENINEQEFPALTAAFHPVEFDERNLRHVLAVHPDLRPVNMCEVLAWMLRYGLVNPEVLHIAFKNVLEEWEKEDQD